MTDLPTPDALMGQIHADQLDLLESEKELQAALIAYRDGRYQTLVAQAKLQSIRAHVDILKARLIAKQALLKGYPR